MTIRYAVHAAAAVKQIGTVTVANTWAAADTATLTMNGKALVVTIGADTSTTQVAAAIRDAWNATSRLDSEGATDATSNFGGQEFGEFAEVTASIDPDTPSVVTLTANKAGVPFTVTVTEVTAGTGTATGATAQAATGPWHWDNGQNWSIADGTLGTVPANDDTVVFKDQTGANVGFKYGLPNASKEVTIQHWMSYTGQLGLPAINTENGSKPYYEYRQRYVRLDDAGTGTNIAHRFGLGKDGTGSPLINLKHVTLKCSPIVYNTGTPQISGTKALNICCTANTSTLNILNGSVDFSSQDGSASAFVEFTQTGGDSRGITAIHTSSAAVDVRGGTSLIGGEGAINSIIVGAGTLRLENQTGTITIVTIQGTGIVDYASTATMTTLNILGGSFDARSGVGLFAAGTVHVYAGGKFIDPYNRISITDFQVLFEPSESLQFGANQTTYIKIDKP